MDYPQRADYMAHKITHHEFYSSVAKEAGVGLYRNRDVQRWAEMLASGDEHLNKLGLEYWDRLADIYRVQISTSLRKHGDFWSLAGGVCVVKAAARNAVEAFNRKEVS